MSSDLFSTSQLTDFWPSEGRSYIDNTNATIRFILYAASAVYLLTGDFRVVYLGLIIIGFLIYSINSKGISYFNEDYDEPKTSEPPSPILNQNIPVQENPVELMNRQIPDRTIPVPKYDPTNFMNTAFPGILRSNGVMGRTTGDPDQRGAGFTQNRALA